MSEMEEEILKQRSGHSAFWPLLILLVVLLVNYGMGAWAVQQQRRQLKTSLNEVGRVLPAAKRVNTAMDGLARNLLAMAPNSAAAQQIVDEFHIQLSASSTGSPAAIVPSPAAANSPLDSGRKIEPKREGAK